ncbi:MAG: hypothetical protein IPL31_17520 [Saprospiraceae bacterium]|nr:hypothetical protein [Saprospiraceae bacterium]
MNNNKHFIALSIGPIHETLRQAKRCRELWVASYMFSWFIKYLYLKVEADSQFNLWFPYIKEETLTDPAFKNGAGRFADHMLIEIHFVDNADNAYNTFLNLIKETIAHLANETSVPEDDLRSYFIVYTMLLTIDQNELTNQGISIVQHINQLLDQAECARLPRNYNRIQCKQNIFDKANNGFFAQDGIPDTDWEFVSGVKKSARFLSIPEIACSDLITKDSDKFYNAVGKLIRSRNSQQADQSEGISDDDDLYETLKTEGIQFSQHHKYYALVHCDGDNMGSVLGRIGNDRNIVREFSNLMMDFGTESAKLLNAYGAKAIFLGGDDLLFLAPILSEKQGIIGICDDIEKKWKEMFSAFCQTHQLSSDIQINLSWGISISYYKSPLKESYMASYDILFEQIKKKTAKNRIGIVFKKHSGQTMQAIIPKDGNTYDTILNKFLNAEQQRSEISNGMIYKIASFDKLFRSIANTSTFKNIQLERWSNFFNNSFDNNDHSTSSVVRTTEWKDNIRDLCKHSYMENKETFKVVDDASSPYNYNAFQIVYTVLRLSQFVMSETYE